MKKNTKSLLLTSVMTGAILGGTFVTDANVLNTQVVYAQDAVAKTVNTSVNFRYSPYNNSTIIKVLKAGDVVMATEVEYGWNKVTVNGVTGYVYGKFLNTTPGATPNTNTATTTATTTTAPVVSTPVTTTKTVNVASVNFRYSPYNNSKIIKVLHKGQVVTATEDKYGWNKVTVDGVTGYVFGKFLD